MWCAAELCPGATYLCPEGRETALEQEQLWRGAATWEQRSLCAQKDDMSHTRLPRKGRKTSTSASAAYRCARLVHWREGGGGRRGGGAGCDPSGPGFEKTPTAATTFDAINSL